MNEKPDKSLGQHWLTDEFVLEDICNFAGVQKDDTVLEIGPGLGTLTQMLLNQGAKVYAVEFDPQLAENLSSRIVSDRLTIEHGDILQYDFAKLPVGYKVVANVPYYITSQIVRRLLEAENPPKSATLLVQKEVAERIAARAGEMSLLSVSAQFYAEVSLGEVVPAALFTPPPKVDSQTVRLDYIGPRFANVDIKDFFRLAKAGFAERRKKLRSSLAGGLLISKEQADELVRWANIKTDARAQELSLEEWHSLYQAWRTPGI